MSQTGSSMRNQLTREDMLRELELLPVWQLKQPLPSKAAAPHAAIETVAEADAPVMADITVTEPQTSESTQAESLAVEVAAEYAGTAEYTGMVDEPVAAMSAPLRLLLSDDSSFAFLIEPHPAEADVGEVETLLKNMIRAMRLNCRVDVTDTADKLFAGNIPRLIISMGAAPANLLLGKTADVDQWRNTQQQAQPLYENIPLLVTYHPAHLLENASDKAHAWRDLCLAMKLMQSL